MNDAIKRFRNKMNEIIDEISDINDHVNRWNLERIRLNRDLMSDSEIQEIESHLSKDADIALSYAEDVLGGPFPLGEPVIAKSEMAAMNYARHVIKRRFPLCEPLMLKKTAFAISYWSNVATGPWKELEEVILSNDNEYELAKDALFYAQKILKGPFPEAEYAIAKYGNLSIEYSAVISSRFELGEESISLLDTPKIVAYCDHIQAGRLKLFEDVFLKRITNGEMSLYDFIEMSYYISNVVQGRWKEFEDCVIEFSLKNEEFDDFCYVDYACNIIKGRWEECEDLILDRCGFYELKKYLDLLKSIQS